MDNIVLIACIVGFVGDASLQLGSHFGLGGPTGWGLNDYFKQHRSAESLFIAGGMMSIFYVLLILSKLPINFLTLAIYGVLLDLIFRKFMVFGSLKGYYNYFNYFWSAVWAIIPMWIPFAIYKLFNR